MNLRFECPCQPNALGQFVATGRTMTPGHLSIMVHNDRHDSLNRLMKIVEISASIASLDRMKS